MHIKHFCHSRMQFTHISKLALNGIHSRCNNSTFSQMTGSMSVVNNIRLCLFQFSANQRSNSKQRGERQYMARNSLKLLIYSTKEQKIANQIINRYNGCFDLSYVVSGYLSPLNFIYIFGCNPVGSAIFCFCRLFFVESPVLTTSH